MDLPQPKEMAHEFLERYESGEFTHLYSDVLDCLQAVESKHIPMIVISNYSPLLERFLTTLGISKFFKAALISGIAGVEKPDPEIYRMGAESLALPPDEIVHIGNDLEEDYHAAQNAGYQVILLDRDRKCKEPAIRKIATLSELLPILSEA